MSDIAVIVPFAPIVETAAIAPLPPPPPLKTRASPTTLPVPAVVIVKVDEIGTFPIVTVAENPEPPPPVAAIVGALR